MSTRIQTDGGVAFDVKDDDDMIHARVWLEKFPGWWEEGAELALDPDDLVVGTRLLEQFAVVAVDRLHLRDGTHYRIARKGAMQDFVVRAGLCFGLERITP